MKKKGVKKGFWRKFFAWCFFAAACVGYGVIMYEAAQDGATSSQHSGTIGDMVPDDVVDEVYDNENVIAIKDFSVSLSPSQNEYSIGDVIEYSYTFDPENTTYKDIDVVASPESSVSINNGKITCLEEGTTAITFTSAKNEKLKKTIAFDISPIIGTGLEIGSDLNMVVGDVKVLDPIVTPENTTDKRITYSSSDTSVAQISNDGVIKALSVGTSVISASLTAAPTIVDTIEITVSNQVTESKEVTYIKLPSTANCYAKETLTISGTFTPKVTSSFDLAKLSVVASDEKLTITKSSLSLVNGTFTLKVVYTDSTITESKDIKLTATYEGTTLKSVCTLTVSPLLALSTSMISSTQKTSYSGSIVSFSNYQSENIAEKIKLVVNYLDTDVKSTPKAFDTANVKWLAPSSLNIVSFTYKTATLEPVDKTVALDDAEVYFYPNVNSEEHITYKVSYALFTDETSITGIESPLLFDGMNLSTDCMFSSKVKASLTLSGSTAHSNILSSTGFNAEIVTGSDLAYLTASSTNGIYSLRTKTKTGQIVLRLSSALDSSIFKDITINLVKKVDRCLFEYNGIKDKTSAGMKKGEVASFRFMTYMRNEFADGTYQDKYWAESSFNLTFSKENVLSYTKSKNLLMAYGDSQGETITITAAGTKDTSLSATFKVTVSYVAPVASEFTLDFKLSYYPGQSKNELNKPTDLNKIAVGTKLKATGKVNSTATNQKGHYVSSNSDILTVNSNTGLIEAISPGEADIEFHSNDDPSVFIKETIQVVDAIGAISINKKELNAVKFELLEAYDGTEFASCKLAYGKSYSLMLTLPNYATSDKISFYQDRFLDADFDEGILTINKEGTITLNGVGKTFIYIVYGDSETLNTYEYVLEVEVLRDMGSFWSNFLYKIRKFLGHFGVFMICAMCSMIFVGLLFKKLWQWAVGAGVCLYAGFTFAGLSELIQKFTPGRVGCWSDIWIDFKGTLLGISVICVILLTIYIVKVIYNHHSKKKGAEINHEEK